VVALVVLYSLFTRDTLTTFQRWCLAAVVGGGLGNNIDRIFRPTGVVDFVQMKVFGLFGMEYWPVYNLADATLVVSGILLVISFLLPQKKAGVAAPGGTP
jgi:signal peptidase II